MSTLARARADGRALLPEQHVEFAPGKTVRKLTFKTPGEIELEEHSTDTLIAQLEVR